MAYTSVQFIAYVINTFPKTNSDGSQTYLGLDDAALDIEARCALMQRAMEAARAALPAPTSPPAADTPLKIFLAPEFFFRGKAGAYEIDDVDRVTATLQRMSADPIWADWVFGFGTILGMSSPTPTVPAPANPPKKEIYNFLLIQEGGVTAVGPAGATIVMKELKSDIDFISGRATPGSLLLGQVDPLDAGPDGPGREQQKLAYDGGGVFLLRGITFAAEICLDHISARLIQSPQLPGDQLVQIQLVPSAGAHYEDDSVVAMDRGYVFNVDGGSFGTTVFQVNETADVPTEIHPTSSTQLAADPVTLTSVSPPQDVAINQIYSAGAGRVAVFPPQPIPAAAVAPGSRNTLVWRATADYTFTFDLVYDEDGEFMLALVKPSGGTVNFHGRQYYMPLNMKARDPQGRTVTIKMQLLPGQQGFDHMIAAKIDAPGFAFEGAIMRFKKDYDPTTKNIETIW